MPFCRLCETDQELRNSHIVPEFLFSNLYNEKHQLLAIHGHGPQGSQLLQKGIREPLFCETCEQHFNKHFEKPFHAQWIKKLLLPNPWVETGIHWITVDYTSFKLFHLSVLFRAGVSSLPTFSEVNLGPHEEKMRRLILACNPGTAWQYPIIGHAVIHHKTNGLIPMVSRPRQSKFGGRRCYGMVYGGAQWWICVASDKNQEFEQCALQPDGRMPFHATSWNEIGAVQEASAALRNARP